MININIMEIILDIKYTCPMDRIAARSTKIAEGENALIKDKANTIGILVKRVSYPIEELIN